MSQTTRVYGYSDDCIEFEGGINDELNAYWPALITFTNGVTIEVEFDPDGSGCWRIKVLEGAEHVTIEPALGADADDRPDGSTGYSDLATITHEDGKPLWVLHYREKAEGDR